MLVRWSLNPADNTGVSGTFTGVSDRKLQWLPDHSAAEATLNIECLTAVAAGDDCGLTLRRQTFSCDQFHFLAETVQLIERGVNVRRDANALEFFVHDGHGKYVVFIEEIFRHCVRIGAVDVNISYCARLVGIQRSVEPNFGYIFEPVHPITGQVT